MVRVMGWGICKFRQPSVQEITLQIYEMKYNAIWITFYQHNDKTLFIKVFSNL